MRDGLPDSSALRCFKALGQSCPEKATCSIRIRQRSGRTASLAFRRPGSFRGKRRERKPLIRRKYSGHPTRIALVLALLLAACAKSFDMSDERLSPLGPEWGIVIGSVLVKPVKLAGESSKSGDAPDTTYDFDIVQSQPGDPEGETPYAERYRLQSKAGEERVFISRLRTGRYMMRSFAQDRMAGKGGDLGIVFDSMAGEVRYVGRLLVEV